ncbi:UNVERIFIED_CONTAM: hypothetical protein GTU68_043922 [Idotea baltica]|nr:hypothetical protein [Idotea baltica]
MVGDVFVVGAKLPDTCVYPEFNALNSDATHPVYGTTLGAYKKGCGLDSVDLAWGHDEYLYQVLNNHQENRIPEAGMVMVRYHSFYPWHTGDSYSQFTTEKDDQYKEWIKDFNKYDLYTKSQKIYALDEVREYYQPIVEKYLGSEPIYF